MQKFSKKIAAEELAGVDGTGILAKVTEISQTITNVYNDL